MFRERHMSYCSLPSHLYYYIFSLFPIIYIFNCIHNALKINLFLNYINQQKTRSYSYKQKKENFVKKCTKFLHFFFVTTIRILRYFFITRNINANEDEYISRESKYITLQMQPNRTRCW
jgi:hypothetical protein